MKLRVLRGAAVATIATLATHFAAYRIAVSDPEQRGHVLAETGHGWTGMLWPAVIVAAAVLLAGAFVSRKPGRNTALGAKTVYLAAAGAFLTVETVERWTHMGSVEGAAENLLTWQGGLPVLLGLLLLTAVSPLIVGIEHAVREKIAALLCRPAMTPTEQTRPGVTDETPALLAFLTEVGSRGPPARRSPTTTISS